VGRAAGAAVGVAAGAEPVPRVTAGAALDAGLVADGDGVSAMQAAIAVASSAIVATIHRCPGRRRRRVIA
jgi:hypothetical protein